MSHVLCPTDLTEASGRAFEYATALARWFEARLTVLHVVPTPPVLVGAAAAVPPPSDETERARALERFLAERVAGHAVAVETALAKGDAAQAIAAHALETGADLVVAGTHGRRGLPRWLLGSVTEELLRTSPCPLLVVPPHAADSPPPIAALLKRLLCAVDFSEASLRAAELAFSLAREADARVRLLHVVEAVLPTGLAAGEYFQVVEADARERLGRVIPADASDWCEPETRVVRGKPWREIVRQASGDDAGMIVVGVHGHGALDRFFFGSTAEGVVRHASCPVLVARPPHAPAEPAGG